MPTESEGKEVFEGIAKFIRNTEAKVLASSQATKDIIKEGPKGVQGFGEIKGLKESDIETLKGVSRALNAIKEAASAFAGESNGTVEALQKMHDELKASTIKDYIATQTQKRTIDKQEAADKKEFLKQTLAQITATKQLREANADLIKELENQVGKMASFKKWLGGDTLGAKAARTGIDTAMGAGRSITSAMEGTLKGEVMGALVASAEGLKAGGPFGVAGGLALHALEKTLKSWVTYSAKVEDARKAIYASTRAMGDFSTLATKVPEKLAEDDIFSKMTENLSKYGITMEETQKMMEEYTQAGYAATSSDQLDRMNKAYMSVTKTMNVSSGTFMGLAGQFKKMFGQGESTTLKFFNDIQEKSGTFKKQWGMSIDEVAGKISSMSEQFYDLGMSTEGIKNDLILIADSYKNLSGEAATRMYKGLMGNIKGMSEGQRAFYSQSALGGAGGIGGAAQLKYGNLDANQMEKIMQTSASMVGLDLSSLKKSNNEAKKWEAVGLMEKMGYGGADVARMLGLSGERRGETITGKAEEGMYTEASKSLLKYKELLSSLHKDQMEWTETQYKFWKAMTVASGPLQKKFEEMQEKHQKSLKTEAEKLAGMTDKEEIKKQQSKIEGIIQNQKNIEKAAQTAVASGENEDVVMKWITSALKKKRNVLPREAGESEAYTSRDVSAGTIRPRAWHTGGLIFHRGGEVPVLAESGEYIFNRDSASKIGQAKLDAMNATGRAVGDAGSTIAVSISGGEMIANLQAALRHTVEKFVDDKMHGR